MKQHHFNLFTVAMVALYFVAVAACHKDPKPTVYGNWETVNAVGFHWYYDIAADGDLCKRLPEYFPDTAFCYDYDVVVTNDATTVTVHTPTPETWVWDFVCDDVADVTVTMPDGEIQRFILKKINPKWNRSLFTKLLIGIANIFWCFWIN